MAPSWRREQECSRMRNGVGPETTHSNAESFASNIVTDSAPHSNISQSIVPVPEASNTFAIRPPNTKVCKNQRIHSCAKILRRFWTTLSSRVSHFIRQKSEMDNTPLNALNSNTTPGQKRNMQESIIDGSKALTTPPLESSICVLEPRAAKSIIPASGPTTMKESSPSSYFSSAPHQQNEQLGRPSEIGQILCSQSTIQADVAEQSTSQEHVSFLGPEVYAVGIEDSQEELLLEAPEVSENIIPFKQPSKFKTQFKMVIHTSRDGLGTRIAKLDTGSKFNVVSQDVVNELRMRMEPYSGLEVNPIGEPIMPIGTVRLEWHIMKRKKTYRTEFLVFRADQARSFDMLLSETEIAKIGFYKVDDEVWFLDRADE